MGNYRIGNTSVFVNTRAWEQQELNEIKKKTKMVRRDEIAWKEVKQHKSHINQNTIIISIMQ